jgi:hypothetical protein
MPVNYPGNPAGGVNTSPAPAPRTNPTANTPVDLVDPVNASSVAPGLQTPLDWIAFMARQGALGDALGGGATSFDGSANPTTWNDLLTTDGAPISGLDVLPTFAAASGFAVTVGAGSGFLSTSVGIGPGESAYRTIYWAGQNLTHANPDPTNPRYDAITVTPAAFGTPSVLAIVTGTPAALPLAPAIPAGSGVLFYVYVGATVADSTHFRACRGLGRRVGYPWSGMSAIVAGCELSWNYIADPSTTPADIFVGAADQTGTNFTLNRLLIDGEAIEWAGYLSNTTNGVVSDSTADPFGSTASANFDRPYYIYACGGRHNPLPSNTGTGILNPVTICESTVPPNPKTGKPTGNLTVNGVTVTPNGALYIGLGFVVANTTRRRGCLMDGDMTYGLNGLGFLGASASVSGKIDMGTFTGGCQPAISTKISLSASFVNSAGAGSECGVFLENFPTTVGDSGIRGYAPAAGEERFNYVPLSFTPRTGAELWAQLNSGNGVIQLYAMGFDHRVRRLVAGY